MAIAIRLCSAVSFALASYALPATAQEWPTRQHIKVIVPFTAGSVTDAVARSVFEQVGRQVNQTVVVENRTGGGSTIGANAVAKAEPDGYTVLANSSSHVVVPLTFAKLPYNVLEDFQSLTPLAVQPFVLAARTRYKSLADLIKAGKDKPGSLNYSSAGAGTTGMLFTELLALRAGIKMTHVPFRGTPEALTEVVADRVDLYASALMAAVPLAEAGKLSALAVSTAKRSSVVPNVPTLAEAGLSGVEYSLWVGSFLPARTPRPIVDRLNAEIVKAIAQPDVAKSIAKLGGEPLPMSVSEFDVFLRKEIKLNAEIAAAAGIKPQ